MKTIETMNAAYEAPQVDVIEVSVEKGFAGSDGGVYGEGDDMPIN